MLQPQHEAGNPADLDVADLIRLVAQQARLIDQLLAGNGPVPIAQPDGPATIRLAAPDGESEPPTIREVWQAFEARLQRQIAAGERSGRTLGYYRQAAAELLACLGDDRIDALRPADFARLRSRIADGRSKKTLHQRMGAIRTILRSAADLRDEQGRPRFAGKPDYGREFDRPSLSVLRRERRRKRSRSFEPAEILRLLEAAREPLRTMILLGVNGGLGNTDVAGLTWGEIDLPDQPAMPGWLDYPRPKTGVDRRIPLWLETVQALRRHGPAEDDRLCFATYRGEPWVRSDADGLHDDAIVKEFRKVCRRAGLDKAVGFYGLRHAFQSIGDEAGDPAAVSAIMGHVDTTMAGQYRERISDERLRAVVDVVHRKLFGETAGDEAIDVPRLLGSGPERRTDWSFAADHAVYRGQRIDLDAKSLAILRALVAAGPGRPLGIDDLRGAVFWDHPRIGGTRIKTAVTRLRQALRKRFRLPFTCYPIVESAAGAGWRLVLP